ncbi:hypothetical protein CH296_26590 [Rhodococcus sp. 14-2496-1d]|uniref:CoA transferase n=1 Tax=Rhodococcus sp. 14-2496-1d TaxID=2023146 RepID=UPI000B9A76F5|nr:CoA transferase [Rhodococcus sp. 14-2496-1d]OZF25686.1 hypothetical protein CH296_26590 [Rhodococcus sp. 14-2496-1d]
MLNEKTTALPLAGLTVAAVSHSPAAALSASILADLGAAVAVLDRSDLSCDRCLVPRHAEFMYSAGTETLDRNRHADTRFDVLIDDSALCVHDASNTPEWIRYRTDARITAFASRSDGSVARRGSPFTAESAAGVAVALGESGESPLRLPTGVAESIAGLNTVAAVLALVYRHKGARLGRHTLEVSVASSLEYLVGMNTKMFEGYPRTWHREGRRSAGSSGPYPLAIFDAADGLIGMVGRSHGDWSCIIDAMGNPSWADAENYRDPYWVALNCADEVDTYVGAWAKSLTIAEIVAKSHEYGFVAAPVSSMAAAMGEEQLAERGFWTKADDGALSGMRLPFRRLAAPNSDSAGDTASNRPLSLPQTIVADPTRLLADVRVLDFTWVWSGPMTTGILASLGAEVVKVEHPDRKDGARLRGRTVDADGVPRSGPEWEVTPYFHQNGAGKLSLEASLKDPDAVTVLTDLARTCDVVVENMRPGVLQKNGLGFDALRGSNPEMVMLSMSVAGQQGPLARTRGYATVMSGLAGYESLVGYGPDRVTGGYTFAIADPVAGLYGAIAVLSSLIDRDRGTGGSYLDMSQLECILNTLRLPVARELTGRRAHAEGVADERLAAQFACRVTGDDQWVAMSFGTEESLAQFRSTVAAATSAGEQDFWDTVDAWASTRSHEDVVALIEACGGMAAPVVAWGDDRLRRIYLGDEASVSLHHPFGGRERIFVPPWDFDGSRPGFTRRAPLLGEHTAAISHWADSSGPSSA